MKNKILLTPGPTSISKKVLRKLSKNQLNSDLDINFYHKYYQLGEQMQELTNSKLDFLFLPGEGMLGLESAICSLIEKDDQVLVLDNGIFGRYFYDIAKMYSDNVTVFEFDYHQAIDVNKLEEMLMKNHHFKVATLVHVDTPTGVKNDIESIAKVLKKYKILTIVDSVSAIGGEKIDLKEDGVDILLGASQKVISSPVGLTVIGISNAAWQKMSNRKTKIDSFYLNLLLFKNWYQEKWFPYTMPAHLIEAFRQGLKMLKPIQYYANFAQEIRNGLLKLNLKLFLNSDFSNSVTAFYLPDEKDVRHFLTYCQEIGNIILSSSIGEFENKLIRVGHMGNNVSKKNIKRFFKILNNYLKIKEK